MFDLKNSEILLVTQPENVFYLTHFDGEGFVVITPKTLFLATDPRYLLLAKKVKKRGVQLFEITSGWPKRLDTLLGNIKDVRYEDHHMTVAGLTQWKKILPKRNWKKAERIVEKKRLFKSEDELDKLRQAAAIGDKVLQMVLKQMKPGVTEKQMANLFRQYSNELADGVSFDPIVAFGKNGAIPHHHCDNTKLQKNDVILIDQGVKFENYMSDMTRCFFIGKGVPTVRSMYDQLLKVQQAAVNMVRPGVKISDLATAVRAMLGKDERYFTHSLGHGVGLEVHEDPGVSVKSDTILKPGMVITIEPGLYNGSVGGVRIEDTVIVTENGCEVITRSSKDYSSI